MLTSPKKLLIHVEDPGAANFIIPLVPRFAAAGWAATLMASGNAMNYLAERGLAFKTLAGFGNEADLLAACAPHLLLVGTSENPQSPAFALVEAAKRTGTPCVAAIDGPANPTERFRGTSAEALRHAPDWLFLTEDRLKGDFERLGFTSDRIIVTGHPYFDIVREMGRDLMDEGDHRAKYLPDAPPDRPVIIFLSEPSDGLGQNIKRSSEDYTLTGWGGSDRRTEIAIEEFLDAVATLDVEPWLVLRLHPKETEDMYAKYLHHFQKVSSGESALELLCACDLVVGLSTSLLTEAAIMGLRTLSILPHDGQRDLILTVRNGITPCATVRESVHNLLKEQLSTSPPPLEEIDRKIEPGATRKAIDALDVAAGLN